MILILNFIIWFQKSDKGFLSVSRYYGTFKTNDGTCTSRKTIQMFICVLENVKFAAVFLAQLKIVTNSTVCLEAVQCKNSVIIM